MTFTIISRKDAKAQGLKRYFTGKPCKHGHISQYFSHGSCITCQANLKKLVTPETRRRHYIASKNRHLLSHLFWAARKRAKNRPLEFTISITDLVMPPVCPCCGKAFKLVFLEHENFRNGAHPDAPSLDRIRNEQGYVPGNIAIICMRCNALKSDATPADLRRIAEWIESVTRLSTHAVGGAA